MRAPEQPTGWPSAMAPPLTFTVAGSSSSSFMHGMACAANASLSSEMSMSLVDQPARPRAFRVAGTGPIPMRCGSTPDTAPDTIRAMGSSPSSRPRSAETTRRAAAPSLMPDELPAVTVPFFLKTGWSLAKAIDLAGRMTRWSPVALRLAKDAIRAAFEMPLAEGLVYEKDRFLDAFASEDGAEGVAAFVEKRKPNFKGR